MPVVDFWEEDLDQLGEALLIEVEVRGTGCGSAVLLWQLLVSEVCRPRALKSIFPLIPAKQTDIRGHHDTRVPAPSESLPPGTLPGCWSLRRRSSLLATKQTGILELSKGHCEQPHTLLPDPLAPNSTPIPGYQPRSCL